MTYDQACDYYLALAERIKNAGVLLSQDLPGWEEIASSIPGPEAMPELALSAFPAPEQQELRRLLRNVQHELSCFATLADDWRSRQQREIDSIQTSMQMQRKLIKNYET